MSSASSGGGRPAHSSSPTAEKGGGRTLEFELLVSAGDRIQGDRLDTITRDLRSEVEESRLARVRMRPQPAQPGSKGGTASLTGALLVTTLPVALPRLIDLLREWLRRRAPRTLTIRSIDGDRTLQLEVEGRGFDSKALVEAISRIASASSASRPTP